MVISNIIFVFFLQIFDDLVVSVAADKSVLVHNVRVSFLIQFLYINIQTVKPVCHLTLPF